ncbi:PadR family transcriptional regulator [Mumia sp. DW29H23]|uniref:PadR family transcriptional regulator n=1 Tax=Mumia sp. DW29H23 TaxID=3421241 RepID=UPI003D69E56C
MSLRFALLAALLEGDASGYELSKVFDVSSANFWSSTPQQLYRELERLEADGLVDVEVVPQERRPTKKVLSLNAAGRAALHAFASAPAKPPAMRVELMVKVQAADVADLDALIASVDELAVGSRAKVRLFERLRDRMLGGRGEEEYLRDAERVGPYLTLERGLAFERANVAWAERVHAVLAARRDAGA